VPGKSHRLTRFSQALIETAVSKSTLSYDPHMPRVHRSHSRSRRPKTRPFWDAPKGGTRLELPRLPRLRHDALTYPARRVAPACLSRATSVWERVSGQAEHDSIRSDREPWQRGSQVPTALRAGESSSCRGGRALMTDPDRRRSGHGPRSGCRSRSRSATYSDRSRCHFQACSWRPRETAARGGGGTPPLGLGNEPRPNQARGKVAIRSGRGSPTRHGKLPPQVAFQAPAEVGRATRCADAGLTVKDVDAVFSAGLWMEIENWRSTWAYRPAYNRTARRSAGARSSPTCSTRGGDRRGHRGRRAHHARRERARRASPCRQRASGRTAFPHLQFENPFGLAGRHGLRARGGPHMHDSAPRASSSPSWRSRRGSGRS